MRAQQTWASSDASTFPYLDSTSSPPEERGRNGSLNLCYTYSTQHWGGPAAGKEEVVAAGTCQRIRVAVGELDLVLRFIIIFSAKV